MSAVRKQILTSINSITDSKLKLLLPLLKHLEEEDFAIETDLTDEEIAIAEKGRARYLENPDSFVPFNFN